MHALSTFFVTVTNKFKLL